MNEKLGRSRQKSVLKELTGVTEEQYSKPKVRLLASGQEIEILNK
jgi:hypothetical protein